MSKYFYITIFVLITAAIIWDFKKASFNIDHKRVIIVISLIIGVILIAGFWTYSPTNVCLKPKEVIHPVQSQQSITCTATCYCDGVSIQGRCLGVFRNICQ